MLATPEAWIVLAVVGARFLAPLAIPKFPLPASIAALALDLVDFFAHDAFVSVGHHDYQAYDKALDIHYLAMQYLATMRNWVNIFAFDAGRFLFYYRLAGALLFNFLNAQVLFFLFPSVFGTFFLFYEVVRTRWNPLRLSRGLIVRAIVVILVFIKLPQEAWIHLAHIGWDDVVNALRLIATDGPSSAAFWLIVASGALVAITLIVLTRMKVWDRLPPPDWPRRFDADAGAAPINTMAAVAAVNTTAAVAAQRSGARRLFDMELVEKVLFITPVTVIFSRLAPGVGAASLAMAIGIGVIIVANAAVGESLIRRGVRWDSVEAQFAVMGIINLLIAAVFYFAVWVLGYRVDVAATLLSLFMLTLLVTLYDRYQPILQARRDERQVGAGAMS
jgi:hypothetical protein